MEDRLFCFSRYLFNCKAVPYPVIMFITCPDSQFRCKNDLDKITVCYLNCVNFFNFFVTGRNSKFLHNRFSVRQQIDFVRRIFCGLEGVGDTICSVG